MKIVTKQDKIDTIYKRWREQYPPSIFVKKSKYGETRERLKNEKPSTEKEIKAIIGNGSWTVNVCCECHRDCEITVSVGKNAVTICPDCLKKALALVEK